MSVRFGPFESALADRYRFEEELGRGAMGVVYRARDLTLDRLVAIKLLHPMLTNELGVRRFAAEILIAARLRHPNIVGVHESGEANGHLYYAMDFLAGETLRARLAREKQLPVEDALRITADIAEGLQYAHDQGVVHRDVKPENILLTADRAMVVDFGLARALGEVDTQRLTASGLSVGTPHYLSPEQASAEKEVGPKADQYALACVLYEMLVGEPPFTGPTATSIAMRHIAEAPPALRPRRRSTPPAIENAVNRALEKVPADRFGSVSDFIRACRDPEGKPSGWTIAQTGDVAASTSRPRTLTFAAVIGTLLTVTTFFAFSGSSVAQAARDGLRGVIGRPPDSTRFVVFPSARRDGVGAELNAAIDQALTAALIRWSGVTVVPAAELRAAMHGAPFAPATTDEAATIARAVGAGRYVLTDVGVEGDEVRVTVQSLDVRRGRDARTVTALASADGFVRDSSLAPIAVGLLFGPDAARQFASRAAGTTSTTGFSAYLRARAAMSAWNLPAADSALTEALHADSAFAAASVALAEVRFWWHDASPDVAQLASRALDDVGRLSGTDRMHAAALRDFAAGRFAESCARFDSLARVDVRDFGAWYGRAECERKDAAVRPDRRSPSGFAYRASRARGIDAIEHAFDLLSRIDACCTGRAVDVLRRHFAFTSSTQILFGTGVAPDTARYGAYPQLVGDTIAFIPYPLRFLVRPPQTSYTEAVDRQREHLLRVASKRAKATPNNADILELLAEAMELRGDAATVDTIRSARRLRVSPERALALAVNELWLRFKLAVPGDVRELVAVGQLADSLLRHASGSSARAATLLSSVAALSGDVVTATRLSARDEQSTQSGVPPDVMSGARSMLVNAAIGGQADSLRELEARVSNGITNRVLPRDQAMMRTMLLARATALAFPRYRTASLSTLTPSFALLSAEQAFVRGDNTEVRKLLADIGRARVNMRPADLTIDALYPEAWLLAAIGDTTAALERIGPTLDAVRLMPVRQYYDAVVAGTLMQAMALRAELLAGRGDRDGARRWARAVVAVTDSTSAAAREARRRMWQIAR